MKFNQNTVTKLAGAIAATAFLSITAILPQAAFAQSNPGASGDPRVDEPNTNTRVDDPSRPATNMDRPANAAPTQGGVYSNPSGQMNDAGSGGGAGGADFNRSNLDQSAPQPANRIERYSQPGATDPARNTEYLPPANSPERSNSNGRMNDQMNNSGTGGGAGGINNMNRGNDRFTGPSSNQPGAGTYSTPRSQMNNSGSGSGSGGTIDNRINNSTSPGSATPSSGSTINNSGSTTGGGAGGSGSVPGLW
jgi:hypothetical protein